MPDTRATPPAEPLHYVVDLTLADLDAIHGFIQERITPLVTGHPTGSPEYRAALALRNLVATLLGNANFYLKNVPTNDDDLRYVFELRETWRYLVSTASQWSDEPGFDRTRWHEVRDISPADAAARHRQIADQRARAAEAGSQA
ncbi:hypothetical protein [Kitasatospora purpeofusca]|uniref:hypothetical protein n=1 Tax=Kitasatospora purpeofusca TaxID=67352 RepID=UPI00381733A4